MSPAEHLHDSLDRLYSAARRGAYQEFAALADKLSGDLHLLEAEGDSADRLAAVAHRATEVAQILQAVDSGFTAARLRIAEIRAVRNGQGTYGEDGRRRALAVPGRETRRV